MKINRGIASLAFVACMGFSASAVQADGTSGSCNSNTIQASQMTSMAGTYPLGELVFPGGIESEVTVNVKVTNNIGQVPNPYHINNIIIGGASNPIERDGQPNVYEFSIRLSVLGSVPVSVYTEDGWSATIVVSGVCGFVPPAPEPTVPPTTVAPTPERESEPVVPPAAVPTTTVAPTTTVGGALPATGPSDSTVWLATAAALIAMIGSAAVHVSRRPVS